MKRIAIQDANIMIDLLKTGLFDYCLSLDYEFTTMDIILDELYEEQVAMIQPHISSGKFTIIEISIEDLRAIQEMALENDRLSEQDWSAVYFAQQNSGILLTGDSRLKNIAAAKGITICGMLWILDQLVEKKVFTKGESCKFLKKLILENRRLPVEECEKRIGLWCG